MSSSQTNFIKFHTAKLHSHKELNTLQISVLLESPFLKPDLVYQSRKYDLTDKKKEGVIVMNEGFDFVMKRKELFLIIRFILCEEGESIKLIQHLFIEDLVKQKGKMVVTIGETEIRLKYDITTAIHTELGNETKLENDLSNGEEDNLLTRLKITREFLSKITPLRRLKNDVEEFIQEENILRDLKICLITSLFIYQLAFFLVICFLGIYIVGYRFPVRIYITKSFLRYFEKIETRSVEITKNFQFIKEQQLMLINASDNLKRVFYTHDRIYLKRALKMVFSMFCCICLVLWMIHDSRKLIIFIVWVLFLKKYLGVIQKRVSEIIALNEFEGLGKSTVRIFSRIKRILSGESNKLTKTYFMYENQRWFPGDGFSNRTLLFGKLNRKTHLF